MRRALTHVENERGATLVFVGLLLVALFTLFTVAVDVGVWLNTRGEAQRVADATALAGAGVFMYPNAPGALALLADDTARSYAGRNYVGRTTVDATASGKTSNAPVFTSTGPDVDVYVRSDSMLVRVTVRGETAPLFAQLLGFSSLPVTARAAARVMNGGAARCMKPFAVPDIWHDEDGDTNGNRLYDPGETWNFNRDAGDYYSRFDGDYTNSDSTGYGGPRRNGPQYGDGHENDYGRQMTVKVTDPNSTDPQSLEPGIFLPWQIPDSIPPEGDCKFKEGGNETGAATYRANICKCNNNPVVLGQEYPVLTGNMKGPTHQGVKTLIDEDPNAKWQEYVDDLGVKRGRVVDSAWGDDWIDSPRVVKMALFDPTQITKSGMQTITFNNFALFFIEEQQTSQDPVKGRFLNYVSGQVAPVTGSLVRVLQLIE